MPHDEPKWTPSPDPLDPTRPAPADQPPQQPGPAAPLRRGGVEPADQIGREANSDAVHGKGSVSDIAGAKPILP